MSLPQRNKYDFLRAVRWSLKARGLVAAQVDWVLVPFHTPGHWSLAVLDMRAMRGGALRTRLFRCGSSSHPSYPRSPFLRQPLKLRLHRSKSLAPAPAALARGRIRTPRNPTPPRMVRVMEGVVPQAHREGVPNQRRGLRFVRRDVLMRANNP